MPRPSRSWVTAASLAACGLALSAPACDDHEPAVATAQPDAAATGFVVPFRAPASGAPRFGDVPFPSDLFRDVRGDVVTVDGLERVVEHPEVIQDGLRALDGFGRSTGAMFFVDTPLDPTTLPRLLSDVRVDAKAVSFVDVDPASPKRGTQYPALARHLPTLGILSVIPVPGVVLPPGVRHAAVLTRRVTTIDGTPLALDAPLVKIAKGARGTPTEKLYGNAMDELVTARVVGSADELASLAVFTTSRRAFELPELRKQLRTMPPPALLLDAAKAAPYSVAVFGASSQPSLDAWLGKPDRDDAGREWPGGDNPGGIAHDAICAVASGAFVAPTFRDPTTKRFARNGSGAYEIADAAAKVPVTIVIPKTPPPVGGYPVVVHGHGLSNDRGSMLSYANELARAGFAVVGIDDVEHGARGGQVDLKNNYKGSYAGPDGIPDKQEFPLAFFADFKDFVAVRDNFRQTVLDQTSLVRLVENPELDLQPLASACGFVPKLSPVRLAWSGGSLGGMMGTMTMAVEPDLRAAALQVPGGGFVQFITTGSAKLAPLVSVVANASFGIVGDDPLDEFHPIAQLLGAATEAGDPLAYAQHVSDNPLAGRAAPDLLVTYAESDEVMPNSATAALIRALGLEVADKTRPELWNVRAVASPISANVRGRTAVAVAYAPANHGLGYNRYDTRDFQPGVPRDEGPRFPKLKKSFTFEEPIREHAAQLVAFLTSADAGGAVVTVTAPPRADFDGDGVDDASDTDPLSPTVK